MMVAVLLWDAAAWAAPLPPLPAVDVCGVIVAREWVAEQHLKAKPGASGSLGRERVVPAHLRVILDDVTGVSHGLAQRLSLMAGAPKSVMPEDGILLLLPVRGPSEFSSAVSLCVTGYMLRGDEGIVLPLFSSISAR